MATSAYAQAPADSTETASADHGRFRFGIDATGGLESVSVDPSSLSAAFFGGDLRLGWQIDNLLGVFLQQSLTFGSFGEGILGASGTYVTTVNAEATFADRFYASAGVGYGVLNNPSGFAVELRGGFYPIVGHGDDGVRRKGLMIGVDFRSVFADPTGIQVMGCIGYEAF